uniref:Uncharacterized protein n=1 Tax=Podarcis muralis TaxID=64176 RepID=A0A670IFT4_PODMU
MSNGSSPHRSHVGQPFQRCHFQLWWRSGTSFTRFHGFFVLSCEISLEPWASHHLLENRKLPYTNENRVNL